MDLETVQQEIKAKRETNQVVGVGSREKSMLECRTLTSGSVDILLFVAILTYSLRVVFCGDSMYDIIFLSVRVKN